MFHSSYSVPKLKSRVECVRAASNLGCPAGEAGAMGQSCWAGCLRAWMGALMLSLMGHATSGNVFNSDKEKITLDTC